MWVHDDVAWMEAPDHLGARLASVLAGVSDQPRGIERHAALVAAFILAGELAQALADGEFEATGMDARSPCRDAADRLLLELAAVVDRSWLNGLDCEVPDPALADDLLRRVAGLGPLRVKRAEGYALYAVYPESFAEAARRSGLGLDCRVVGIRSIGVTLGAMVAAALGTGPATSVRPTGDPFRRVVSVSPELSAELAEGRDRPVAVVDEGPGLSGSSFLAVAGWARRCGVRPHRIHLFPSHEGGPGPQASADMRARWQQSPRHPAGFEPIRSRLEDWIAAAAGPLMHPLEDISAGGWRQLRAGRTDPPVHPGMERRKYLARTERGALLVKFAGLGEEGRRKHHVALRLAEAGLTPRPVALCHGFLVEHWMEGAPLDMGTVARSGMVARLGEYIGFRARHLPPNNRGAGIETLFAMARHNAGKALGTDFAEQLGRMLPDPGRIEARVRRISTDNRLHAFEWLVVDGGRIVKTDALDHNAGHDLVGCQDVAWDVAGAMVEFALTEAESEELRRIIAEVSGNPVDEGLVAAMLPCYLAFQVGLWTMAAEAHPEGGGGAAAARYARRLETGFAGTGLVETGLVETGPGAG